MSLDYDPSVTRHVHLIPTSLDYLSDSVDVGRIGPVFERTRPDRAYILYNSNPKGHELNEDSRDAVEELVETHSLADETGGIKAIGIDFFDFNSAVADIYERIYREQKLDNEITIHISGGTKLVSMALAFSCTLTEVDDIRIYYVAKEYELKGEEGEREVKSEDIIDNPFRVPPLDQLEITHIIPSDDEKEKKELLNGLATSNEPKRLTELLRELDIFESLDQKESTITTRYTRKKDQLEDDGLVVKENEKFKLTPTGELVGKLQKRKQEVDDELSEYI